MLGEIRSTVWCKNFADLGNKPDQATVDSDTEAKIQNIGKYDPFNNYCDCLKLLI